MYPEKVLVPGCKIRNAGEVLLNGALNLYGKHSRTQLDNWKATDIMK